MRLLNRLVFLIFVVTPLVLLDAVEKVVLQNAQDQKQPEHVHCLQTGEQRKGDVLADPALVLLRFPVQFERPNRTELCQDGPEDLQIQYVSQVDPHDDEHPEVRHSEDGVEVIERFRRLQPSQQSPSGQEQGKHTARKKSETS